MSKQEFRNEWTVGADFTVLRRRDLGSDAERIRCESYSTAALVAEALNRMNREVEAAGR